MTTLAENNDYLVEFEAGYLTISRFEDGHCKGWNKRGIAGEFRDCLKRKGVDWTINFYLHLMRKGEWEGLYKPERMPRKGISPIGDVYINEEGDRVTATGELIAA
jgi:hypothetical protein